MNDAGAGCFGLRVQSRWYGLDDWQCRWRCPKRSPWFAATAPEGTQAAFLQRNLSGSFIARTQSFPEPGNYTIRFSLVRRGLGFEANDGKSGMDGVSLGRVSNFNRMTCGVPSLWTTTARSQESYPVLVGVRSGGDYTSALDDIQILHEATFQVRFAPTVGGPQTATLSIDNNDPDEAPFDLVLRGTSGWRSRARRLHWG